jgi:hypothetical protein
VGDRDFIPLRCGDETLATLAANLTGFAPADGAPDWLVSGVWLCTRDEQFLATASVEVLGDGYLARPLNIDRPAELAAQIEADLPDIQGRLMSRGSGLDLPSATAAPSAPSSLNRWPAGTYSMSVLARVARRASIVSRVACALLFASEDGGALLVGTGPSTLAIVFSEDRPLIARYRRDCEKFSLAEYRAECSA